MEIHFPPDLEAKLTSTAAKQGRNADEFLQEVVARYLAEEELFVEAVTRGEVALQHGDHLTHEQVGQRLKRFL